MMSQVLSNTTTTVKAALSRVQSSKRAARHKLFGSNTVYELVAEVVATHVARVVGAPQRTVARG